MTTYKQDLTAQLRDSRKTVDQLNRQIRILNAENKKLQKEHLKTVKDLEICRNDTYKKVQQKRQNEMSDKLKEKNQMIQDLKQQVAGFELRIKKQETDFLRKERQLEMVYDEKFDKAQLIFKNQLKENKSVVNDYESKQEADRIFIKKIAAEKLDYERECKALKDQIDVLKTDKKTAEHQTNKVQREVDLLRSSINKDILEQAKLKEEIKGKVTKIEEIEGVLKQKEKEIIGLKKTLHATQRDIHESNIKASRLRNVQRDLKQAEDKNRIFRADLQAEKAQVDILKVDKDKLIEKCDKLKESNEKLSAENLALLQTNKEVSEKLKDSERTAKHLSEENVKKEEKIDRLTNELRNTRTAYQNERTLCDHEVRRMKEYTYSELVDTKNMASEAGIQRVILINQNKKLIHQVSCLEQRLTKATEDIKLLSGEREKLLQEKQKMSFDKDQYYVELEKVKGDNNSLKQEISHLKLQENISKKKFEENIQSVRQTLTHTESVLANVEDENRKLCQRIEIQEKQIREHKEQLTETKRNLESFHRLVEEKAEQIRELESHNHVIKRPVVFGNMYIDCMRGKIPVEKKCFECTKLRRELSQINQDFTTKLEEKEKMIHELRLKNHKTFGLRAENNDLKKQNVKLQGIGIALEWQLQQVTDTKDKLKTEDKPKPNQPKRLLRRPSLEPARLRRPTDHLM
ncbi:repetitive organellar protein [Nothobranchius furzeri]|uniref:Myosin-11-like n=1 Tax=Nothobranchius furzeri TaxID=105023 RepID=A0A9D2YHH2_NOTFU|nr:myosin-11-like [Nothobranchius furzeri]